LSLIRKALWPSAIALGFLVFLGAIGQGNVVKPALADDGDICLILSTAEVNDDGEFRMTEGETDLFVAIVESEAFDDDLGVFDGAVDLDDDNGDANITSEAVEEGDDWDYRDDIETDFLTEVGIIHGADVNSGEDDIDDLETALNAIFGDDENDWNENLQDEDGEANEAAIGDNLCGDSNEDIQSDLEEAILDALVQCADVDDELCDGSGDECGSCDITWENHLLVLEDVAAAAAAIIMDVGTEFFEDFPVGCDGDDVDDIEEFHNEFEDWLFLEYSGGVVHPEDSGGDGDIFGAGDSEILADTFCEVIDLYLDMDFDTELGADGWIIVDVTCEDAGTFDLSFSISGENEDAEKAVVVCVGEVDEGKITATPSKVETVPAMGSVGQSLIVVNLLDENGDAADEGNTVTFTTDICEFNDEDGLDQDDLEGDEGALEIFADYDPNHPDTAEDVTDWFENVYAPDDPDDVSNDVAAVTLSDDFGDFDQGDTIAAIILDCEDEDVKPGVANVCFDIDIEDQDVLGCVKVTVVGPPAKVTAAAAPASLICGEKATISIDVLDAANQPVSDHTRVEAVTNIGGVLGGTGAVAGQAGLVTPVSSTVAETFNGKSTIYLVTSDAHTGPYEVVIATGGQGSVNTGLGGVFSTPPQVTQVTVTCTQPAAAPAAPAPTVTAPRTGTGTISPPNTGDAGLAAPTSGGISWVLALVAGVAAFSVAGLATLKISRR
jgi:hypothetical protein